MNQHAFAHHPHGAGMSQVNRDLATICALK
jgi:hypothetical protein